MIEVCKPPVPQCSVKGTGAGKCSILDSWDNLAIENGCIVGSDVCSEQECFVTVEEHFVMMDGHHI